MRRKRYFPLAEHENGTSTPEIASQDRRGRGNEKKHNRDGCKMEADATAPSCSAAAEPQQQALRKYLFQFGTGTHTHTLTHTDTHREQVSGLMD